MPYFTTRQVVHDFVITHPPCAGVGWLIRSRHAAGRARAPEQSGADRAGAAAAAAGEDLAHILQAAVHEPEGEARARQAWRRQAGPRGPQPAIERRGLREDRPPPRRLPVLPDGAG